MDKYLQWIRTHERLILILAAILAIWLTARKWIEHRDAADHDKAVVARAQVDADAKVSAAANQHVDDLKRQNADLSAKLDRLEIEVRNGISTRNSQTDQRKQIEQTAPLVDIARRWATLIKSDNGAVHPVADGTIVASDAASRSTVQQLEDGETFRQNYSDLARIDSGKDGQIKGLNDLVASMDSSAKAQQVLLADQIASCKATLKDEKDQAGKRSRRSFWRGAAIGAGIVTGVALRFL